MSRANFKESVKRALAENAGHRCSFPGCGAITIGPSSESDNSVSHTGMACHIFAASDGPSARRVNDVFDDEKLSDISNGIWMCYTHGKLIDTDESTYTVDQLKIWKRCAEVAARVRQIYGGSIDLDPDFFKTIEFPVSGLEICSLGQESSLIGEAVQSACVSLLWGKTISLTVRDALIEIVRNSLTHGNSKKVILDISDRKFKLITDGTNFNPLSILEKTSNRGGFHAIDELVNNAGNSVHFSHYFNEGKNEGVQKSVSPCGEPANALRLLAVKSVRRVDAHF